MVEQRPFYPHFYKLIISNRAFHDIGDIKPDTRLGKTGGSTVNVIVVRKMKDALIEPPPYVQQQRPVARRGGLCLLPGLPSTPR